MSGRPWFKCYPSDFLNGISALSPNEIAVYTVVLMLIYDNDGSVPDNPERIARQCNMRPTSCGKALQALVDAGKLVRRDGTLTNPRAEIEIKSRQKVGQKSAQNAKARWEKRAEKVNENNDGGMRAHCESDAEPMPTRSQSLDNRVTPLRGSADAPLRDQIFGAGLAWLANATERQPQQLRPLLGRWCRDFGDEPVMAALAEAQRQTPVDPIAWIQRKFNGKRPDDSLDAFVAAAGKVASGGQ